MGQYHKYRALVFIIFMTINIGYNKMDKKYLHFFFFSTSIQRLAIRLAIFIQNFQSSFRHMASLSVNLLNSISFGSHNNVPYTRKSKTDDG